MKSGTDLHSEETRRQSPQTKRITDIPPSERRRSPSRKRRLNPRFKLVILALCVLLAVSLCMLVVLVNRTINLNDPLLGRWDLDGITAYEFGDNRMGRMLLPDAEYDFKYTVKGDSLSIDFDYEGAKDAVYQFSAEGDTLVLAGGTDTTQGTYTLTRIQ